MLVIAIDYGTKKMGLAVSETELLYAKPIQEIQNNNWNELDRMIIKWLPELIIVGYPINMNGKKQKITKKVDQFCNKLKKRYKIPIITHDERLTTIEAKSIIFQKGGFKALTRTCIHSISAKIILESWITTQDQKKRIL
ncbi:Holliday junction resolvase RuvX [Buchnera aphidicola]|uniref:Holliday junction resolvase RuvX n=1 Tax=Buchnera aphidicola TaxID=9 RepID=UPI00094D9ADE|nr:Holliday junction resolvase RuvX [Buchnera aphidicola]